MLDVQTRALLGGTLDPASFDHEAHIRVAWDLQKERGPEAGGRLFADGLRAYTARHGAADKFHETLTVAFLALISHHLDADGWDSFRVEAARLFEDPQRLLWRFYSPEILADPAARRAFVAPDRMPLP